MIVNDFLMLVKLFVFFLFVQWLMSNVKNKTLFIALLLIVGYYIFFEKWSIIGTIVVLFLVFIVGGLGGFFQDIIFQFTSIPQGGEERMAASPNEQMMYYNYGIMSMLQRRR